MVYASFGGKDGKGRSISLSDPALGQSGELSSLIKNWRVKVLVKGEEDATPGYILGKWI